MTRCAGLWLLRCCLLIVATGWMALAQGRDGIIDRTVGFVDSVRYVNGNQVWIEGWLHDPQARKPGARFHVYIGGQPSQVLNTTTLARPDVATKLHLKDDSALGFQLNVLPPISLGDVKPVVVAVSFDDATLLELPGSSGALTLGRAAPPKRHIGIAVVCIITILLLAAVGSWRHAKTWRWQPSHQSVFLACAIGFAGLVATGLTGSSLGALIGSSGQSGQHLLDPDSAMHPVAGSPRSVRSDEWLVTSASALAQVNHVPPFPIVNTNLGVDGENMLVMGMAGVPIAHVSALARPATWGFFALPLPQALAWYWYFPWFACLLALWCLLSTLVPERPHRNIALALLFCSAPYAAGWSYWPLYVLAYACAALAIGLRMLRQAPAPGLYLSGIVLGWLLASFALVLYPPWQITVALLCTVVFASQLLRSYSTIASRSHLATAFTLGIGVCAILLYAWWVDASTAISAMRATVYPGQRAALHGGDAGWLQLLRGYTNLDTLFTLQGSASNESEFSSYFFLFLPLVYLGLRHAWHVGARAASGMLATLGFMVFALFYGIEGIPQPLSKALFWSYVPGNRLDLALALASILVMAWLPGRNSQNSTDSRSSFPSVAGALLLATFWAALVGWAVHLIPLALFPRSSAVLVATSVLCAGALAYWWARGRIGMAISFNLLLHAIAIGPFTPLALAPQQIVVGESVRSYLAQAALNNGRAANRQRVLVLGASTAPSMALAAAGVPVVGGVFYYPQPSLWKQMALDAGDWEVVNRYQHLTFSTQDIQPAALDYRVAQATPDTVQVAVDPVRFDFVATGADIVASAAADRRMRDNPSLRWLGHDGYWNWYLVQNKSGTHPLKPT